MDVIDREVEKRLRQSPHFQNITVSARALESGVVKPGINYCSDIYRFTINYEKHGHKHVKSVLVKAPYTLRYYEFFKEFQLFTKEIHMYNVVFPLFKSLLPNQSLQPEFYGTDGKDALILEDLSYSGYKLLEAHKQLDLEHSVVALKLLAKFHALSVKVHEIQPKLLDAVRNETFLTTKYLQLKAYHFPIFNSQFEKVLRRAAPSYAEQHSEMLHFLKMDASLLKTVVHELGLQNYSFYVLNHGDFHTNNVLFAYDELGQVQNAKCLDFQSCRWSSPAIDIIFFCLTSVNPPVFEKYSHLLLETYVQTLNATLTHLKCDHRLEMETLRRDMDKISAYWVHTLVFMCPLIVSNLQKTSDDLMTDEFLDDQHYVELTKYWLPYLIQKGVFSAYEKVNQFSSRFPNGNKTKLSKPNRQYNETKIEENFLAGRVLLEFNLRSSIYVKIPFVADQHKAIDLMDPHYREIFMYENVLPRLFELWNGVCYAPLCHAITKNKGLVLEDLEAQGYRAADCKKQLDLDHCRVALSTLAKYHALSVKYIQNSTSILVDALTEVPNFDPSVMDFCSQLYSRFLNLAQTLVSMPAHRKLCEYEGQLENKWVSLTRKNGTPTGFKVIAHSNFFTYNILFKYDECGRVQQAKMVDWQYSRVDLPVLDLVYFFIGSVPFEVFSAHRDTLLNLYVDTLNETMSTLKCNCTYSRAELDRDLNTYKILFPVFASCVLQIIMTTNDPREFSFQRTNEFTSGNYSSEVAKWLNYFVENGII